MTPYEEGLRKGVKHGDHRQGKEQEEHDYTNDTHLGCSYTLGTQERHDWQRGFGQGCQLHTEFNQRVLDAIEGEVAYQRVLADEGRQS